MIGGFFAFFVLATGRANMIIFTTLWLLYGSIVHIGQTWFGFGWESQLMETGFLCIFLTPTLFSLPPPSSSQTPPLVRYGLRWLLFRIMLGAGLIKIRGDECWRDLTCMNYHYETQPVPNPISCFLHSLPPRFHTTEVLFNHFVELITPFFYFMTRDIRVMGGVFQVIFQSLIIMSGNLSFLNWLTIFPALSCFDDAFLSSCWSFIPFHNQITWIVQLLSFQGSFYPIKGHNEKKSNTPSIILSVLHVLIAFLLLFLSIPVVQNLLSSSQAMNTSFDTFRIVNTYGAFGSVTKERHEIILEVTDDQVFLNFKNDF